MQDADVCQEKLGQEVTIASLEVDFPELPVQDESSFFWTALWSILVLALIGISHLVQMCRLMIWRKRTVGTQSMTTYSGIAGANHPRFRPIAGETAVFHED